MEPYTDSVKSEGQNPVFLYVTDVRLSLVEIILFSAYMSDVKKKRRERLALTLVTKNDWTLVKHSWLMIK